MTNSDLLLMPQPKQISFSNGTLELPEKGFLCLKSANPADLLFSAEKLKSVLPEKWRISASPAATSTEKPIVIELTSSLLHGAEGYTLDISSESINIRGGSPAGVFYGVCTLKQIIATRGYNLPLLSIIDWPDFAARGVMLDISRDKVPTMETLYELVDLLSEWKINQVQLYTEHTFAYIGHEVVWKDASPVTGQEILELDDYCRKRFVELTPNQNSFGHMERWLKHEPYTQLAETPPGTVLPDGNVVSRPSGISPLNPGSAALLSDLYSQLIPHFTSKQLNVGLDETRDLGKGASKEACEKYGVGRVYLDFLLKLHDIVKQHGRKMQFWGDIIMRHPELIPELPKDAIALEWGYEATHPFKDDGEKFAKSGIEFWVCPGTSSWNSLTGRTENCIKNLENAAVNGLAAGSVGFLNTDWGDCGHLQYLPVSYLGFLYGASTSWNVSNTGLDQLPMALSTFAFRDNTGVTGQAVYDFGNAYLEINQRPGNSTAYARLLLNGAVNPKHYGGTTIEEYDSAVAKAKDAASKIGKANMNRADAQLIKDEFVNAAKMVEAGCLVGRIKLAEDNGEDASAMKSDLVSLIKEIIPEHERLWLARNRPGGLTDSETRLNERIAEAEA